MDNKIKKAVAAGLIAATTLTTAGCGNEYIDAELTDSYYKYDNSKLDSYTVVTIEKYGEEKQILTRLYATPVSPIYTYKTVDGYDEIYEMDREENRMYSYGHNIVDISSLDGFLPEGIEPIKGYNDELAKKYFNDYVIGTNNKTYSK